jgi:hypothetical protein
VVRAVRHVHKGKSLVAARRPWCAGVESPAVTVEVDWARTGLEYVRRAVEAVAAAAAGWVGVKPLPPASSEVKAGSSRSHGKSRRETAEASLAGKWDGPQELPL